MHHSSAGFTYKTSCKEKYTLLHQNKLRTEICPYYYFRQSMHVDIKLPQWSFIMNNSKFVCQNGKWTLAYIMKWQNKFTVCLIGVHIEIQRVWNEWIHIPAFILIYKFYTKCNIFKLHNMKVI